MTFKLAFFVTMMVCANGVVMGNTGKSSVQGILSRFDELEERFRKQEMELETLRNKDEALENEIRLLRATNVAMTYEMKQLQSRNTEMVNQIEKLAEKEEKLNIRIAIIEDKARAVTGERDDSSEMILVHGNGTEKTIEQSNASREPLKSDEEKGDKVEEIQQAEGISSFSTYGHNRIRQIELDKPIAFLATMTNHSEHLGQKQPVVFDNTITNIGNAYHPTTGVFTVPVPGVYVFSTTILSYRETADFDFTVNGQIMTRMYAYSSDVYETLSQTVIFNLKQGDDVTVRSNQLDKFVHGHHYSTFSGFLLSASSNDQIVG